MQSYKELERRSSLASSWSVTLILSSTPRRFEESASLPQNAVVQARRARLRNMRGMRRERALLVVMLSLLSEPSAHQ